MRFVLSRYFGPIGFSFSLIVLSLTPCAMAETVTVVEGIKILGNHRAEAIFYYENNWARFRKEASDQTAIESYELIISDAGGQDPVDILLITRFDNADQFAGVEDTYERIMGDRELKLLNDVQPTDFRESVFFFTQGHTQTND